MLQRFCTKSRAAVCEGEAWGMQGRSRNGSSKTGGGDIVEDGGFRRGEGLGDGWEGDRRWQVQGQNSGGGRRWQVQGWRSRGVGDSRSSRKPTLYIQVESSVF